LMARFVHPHFQRSRDLLRGSYDYAVGHRADFVGRASAAIQKAIDDHAARQGKREAAE
jgi:limonene 1,2-monooxygenase